MLLLSIWTASYSLSWLATPYSLYHRRLFLDILTVSTYTILPSIAGGLVLSINSIVLGIASGISILVAQLYGSKDKGQICKCYGSVQTLIVAVGFGLAVLFFALAGWIFKAMQIPKEITSPAALYLRIVAAGIPFLAIYNFYSALIKAKGDSRTPIRCICLSCVLNILLDYLFVACFGWGIAGAASATVLSQALAAVLVGLHLYRQEHPVIRTAPSAGLIVPILQLSITGIVQNGASAISMFFIQGIINTGTMSRKSTS